MRADYNKYNSIKSDFPLLLLDWDVFEAVLKTVGSRAAESGGAIGGSGDSNKVSRYHFDESSQNSGVTYSPDYRLLNQLFKSEWNPKDIRLRGFIHSHPGLMGRPSYGDEMYAEQILNAINDLDCLWLPIINTIPDTGFFRLTPWVAFREDRGVSIKKGVVQIVNAPAESSLTICGINVLQSIQSGVPLNEIIVGTQKTESSTIKFSMLDHRKTVDDDVLAGKSAKQFETTNGKVEEKKLYNVPNTFNRVEKAYDLILMRNARIIAVGAGGAAGWLEDLARAGVGQFVLIDPDEVSETNLATQQTYRKDIGRSKVDCIAERIRDINPTTRIVAIQKSLDDISDEQMRQLTADPIDGIEAQRTIICGLTDSFFAQMRVNRLALNLGLPSLCAQVYKEGRSAEITFTFPGVTPACHRCILSSRYRYYLEQGHENDITSHGTPIFATTRLNAIKGYIALALIHHGSKHPRWGSMLSMIGKRNLLQLRMDPDLAGTLGMGVFDKVFEGSDRERLFFDEVVWLPQDQECPETGYEPCPDCGGTGDLRNVVGKFNDTRIAPDAAVLIKKSNFGSKFSERNLVNAAIVLAINTCKIFGGVR